MSSLFESMATPYFAIVDFAVDAPGAALAIAIAVAIVAGAFLAIG